MKKTVGLIAGIALAISLTACGGSTTSESSTTSSSPVAAVSVAPSPTALSPDDQFAAESGLSGAALAAGSEMMQRMCSTIAEVILKKGNDPKWVNTGMLTWLDQEGISVLDADEATLKPMNLAGARAYCPEYANGVLLFWS